MGSWLGVQIAGWGLYTPVGIRYGLTQKCKTRSILYACIEYENVPTLKEKLTLNGDKTVVVGSALALDINLNTSKYWVNLEVPSDLVSAMSPALLAL